RRRRSLPAHSAVAPSRTGSLHHVVRSSGVQRCRHAHYITRPAEPFAGTACRPSATPGRNFRATLSMLWGRGSSTGGPGAGGRGGGGGEGGGHCGGGECVPGRARACRGAPGGAGTRGRVSWVRGAVGVAPRRS